MRIGNKALRTAEKRGGGAPFPTIRPWNKARRRRRLRRSHKNRELGDSGCNVLVPPTHTHTFRTVALGNSAHAEHLFLEGWTPRRVCYAFHSFIPPFFPAPILLFPPLITDFTHIPSPSSQVKDSSIFTSYLPTYLPTNPSYQNKCIQIKIAYFIAQSFSYL